MLKRESRFGIVKSAGKITVYILMIIPIYCVDTEIAFNYCGSSCEEAGGDLLQIDHRAPPRPALKLHGAPRTDFLENLTNSVGFRGASMGVAGRKSRPSGFMTR